MNRLLLFFCASVLGFSVPAISKPHYVITVPAQMQPSTLERACVTFISIARPLSVHLELRRGDRVHVLAEDTMSILNYSQCFPFQVPVLDEDEEQVWFFHSLVQGDDINFNQTKKVLITRGNQLTFIQTDKPFYKPGQTVKFRVVTLDNSLRASEDQYPVVELQDPHKNCIGQWQNVSPVNGIADFTFPLAEELTLGEYKISIPNKLVKSFTVSEYVLKRFEVLINAPSRISQKDESFTMKACGRYNYGKSVMGSLNIEICRQIVTLWSYFFHEDEDTASESCQVLPSVQTDSTGCVSKVIDLHSLISENSDYDQQLAISCSLTEHNTGQMEKATARVTIGNRQTIEFVDIESYYYKGVPFTGRIKVEDERGNPKKNERVYLELISDDTNSTMSLLTDELGIARFTLETSEWDDMVSLTGKFSLDGNDEGDVEDLMAYKWLSRFYSESSSFLKVESIAEQLECDSEQSIRVDYFLNNKHLDPQSERLSFFYIILANGRIIHHGEYRLNVLEQKSAPTLQSSFYLVIPVTNDLLSEATVLVFTVLMNGEMIAGQERYAISSCFKNKVTLEFSEKRVRPGRKVNLEIKAESGSMCSVRSVDNGLLLHQSHGRTGKSSTLDNLMARIGKMNMFGFPYINEDLEEYPCLETEALDQTQQRHPWFHSAADVYSLFKDSGLKVFTNTKIKMPVSCLTPEFTMRSSKSMQQNNKDADVPLVSTSEEKSEKVRAFFPDTWLYELVPIGPNGLAVLNLTTPDSITSWKTDAFCLGKSGFGETYGTALTSFKPYFIDLMLPYSIIQGEELTLTAIVFSYVKHCVMAVVSLSDSLDFTVTQGARKQFSCICADQTATFTWNITATKPGTIKIHVRSSAVKQEGGCTTKDFDQRKKQKLDALVKSIIVKPSGILNEFAETFLLCPSGNSLHEDISLQIPDDVVPGSEHASVTVHGDIMGKAINNVGHLLKLPFGCGEQNIAIFATNIYIMQYLQSTNQLKPEFKKHASMYLMTGYQRQLLFKHDDGSYSAFGKRDLQGNAWLTAFVLRSFGQAREYIYIEEKNIQASVRWLSSLQMPNGCFRSIGTPFHNRLKSGVEDDVTFAAYITIALLESGTAFNESIAHNALRCLKSHVDVTNTYSQALLAYVFALSGDGDLRHHMLTVLEKKAISGGGAKHWALDPYGNGGVEVSSYVLLALLSAKIHFMKDFAAATNIVSWIIKQQNPWGGFYSTQDTVVALYALSKYAKVIFTESDEVKVKIRSPLGFQFAVDKSKGLLVQSASMPHIPGKYTVTATGRGCVYVQTHLRYHTRPRKLDTHFALRVRTRPALCSSEVEGSFEVLVEVSYVGNRISTNMVIVEVELLSGFISVDESIKKLQNNPLIKRTEVSAEKVTIYLEELKHQTEDFSFFIKQESLVRNLQPAHVHVYDYYNPGEHSKAEYTAPCSSG